MPLLNTSRRILLLGAAFILFCGPSIDPVHAQFKTKWLSVGELQNNYSEGGGEAETQTFIYPGITPLADYSYITGMANWMSARNWTDPQGRQWAVKTVHNGPGSAGATEMFPVKLEVVSRFEPPSVTVDRLETFGRFVRSERVDPSMKADRMIHNIVNTELGLTMERRIMQFSQEHHDDYHLIEYTFTNTGNTDGDDEIELSGQRLDDVYFFPIQNWRNTSSGHTGQGGSWWGRNEMDDVVGDGMEDYETDLRAMYSWHGHNSHCPTDLVGNCIGSPVFESGGPIEQNDNVGRLNSPYFWGTLTVHADRSASDRGDDTAQPRTTTFFDFDRGELRNPNTRDAGQMENIRSEWIEAGHTYPHQADLVSGVTAPWDADRFARLTNDASLPGPINGGYTAGQGYGPYDLDFGQSFNVVLAYGISGLSNHASLEIGRRYKEIYQSGGDTFSPIEFDANGDGRIGDDERMSKQHWVMTSRDSLFQLFERAIQNHRAGYAIPQPPLPPERFEVASGVDRIALRWELYPGESPSGFEIYRGQNSPRGSPQNGYVYDRIASLDGSAREYQDTNVSRGVDYYYYIQAVSAPNSNGTGNTPTGVPLKSNRYWTQTYDPANLKRVPGQSLEAAQVVPNPLFLGSDEGVRWPDRDYRVAFMDIPGNCTISIYTELGELVQRIEHTDGSGDAFWDLSTSSNQIIVSGVYLAIIQDNDSGEKLIRKIIIVR